MTASTTTAARKALVVRGGWEGHVPVEATELFLPFLREAGFAVDIEESLEVYADTERLAATDLVVQCWTSGELTGAQAEGLAGAVLAGTGFAGWHGGVVDAFRGNVTYQLLTGGQFLMHPPGFLDHTVTVVGERADHPVVAGLHDFRVHTEQYWLVTDALNDVLATTTFQPEAGDPWSRPVTVPAVWTRNWGAGRVFVSAIGHKIDDFDVPEVRALTERGLLWASR